MNARTAVVLVAVALLASCAAGPDYHAPSAPAAKGYSPSPLPTQTASAPGRAGAAQSLAVGTDLPGEWWTLFGSPEVDALVADALRRNPDLAAAQAGLREAMENLYAQRGAFLPSIGAAGIASRNRNAVEPAPFLASNQLLYNLYQAQLNASWTLDVFGGNRRAVEALKAEAEAQRFQLESTYLALTANLVAGAIQEASLRAQVDATREIVASAAETERIFRKQYALGEIAGADLAAQEAAFAQARQALPPLERQLAQQGDLLAALTGRLPDEAVPESFTLETLKLPVEVPVSVPSQLVRQRPDVRIAEANLHAACAEVGVAQAAMLPQITLTADPGYLATQLRQLFESGNALWGVAGGVTQPIFQGGTLLHRERAARAAYAQAAHQYRSAVVAAFQNVADALHALESDADLLSAAVVSERAASRSLAIARRQLQLGDISHLGLLTAEQTYQQARIALIQAQASRLSDTAALFQALGGGWWHRTDPGTR